MLSLTNIIDKYKIIFIQILFGLIPLSYVIGNLAININILLIILISIFLLKEKLFKIKFSIPDKLLLLLFFYIFLIYFINAINIKFFLSDEIKHFDNANIYLFLKTIFFFRFFIFYLTVKQLIKYNYLNFKFFFTACTLICVFVSLDIFIQFYFGADIFGIKPYNTLKFSGPFGEELIAGGFLQRFIGFSIYLILLFFPYKYKYFLLSIIIFISFLGILISGNRIPFIFFLLLLFLISLIEIKNKKKLIYSLLICLILSTTLIWKTSFLRESYNSLFIQINQISNFLISPNHQKKQRPPYLEEFETFYDTWKLNPTFGGGIKSFRIYCPIRKNIDKYERSTCNTHPHNYYLEMLSEFGLVGIILIFFLLFLIIKNSFFYLKKNDIDSKLITLFLLLFFLEMFPLKSTGSFSTTGNATYIFLLISFIIGLIEKSNKRYKTIKT